MNYQEFAGKIRQKYPGSYDDMDDQTLARKIVDKYPQYSDVTFDQAPGSVGGFLQNAVTDAKNTVGALGSIGRKVMEAPYDAIQGARQMMGGAKFGDTTIGQNVHAAGEAIRGAVPHLQYGAGGGLELEPGAIARQYQDIGAQPFKMLPGKVGEQFKQAYPNNPFYDQPVTTALALAPVAKPLLGAVPGVASVAGKAQAAAGWAADRTIPAFLKAAKGTPLEVSKMAMRDPSIMDLPGKSASIQARSQDIINAIKEAKQKVGGELGATYAQHGFVSPMEEIVDTPIAQRLVPIREDVPVAQRLNPVRENVPVAQRLRPVTEEVPVAQRMRPRREDIPVAQKIEPLFRNELTAHETGVYSQKKFAGFEPGAYITQKQVTGFDPGGLINKPKITSYEPGELITKNKVTGYEPGDMVTEKQVTGYGPGKEFSVGRKPSSFNDLLVDKSRVQRAFQFGDKDAFKELYQKYVGNETSNVDALKTGPSDQLEILTRLKRSFQNEAVYPEPGQQLTEAQSSRNAAIKKMAGEIDALRGKIPGGDQLAVADDAYSELLELNHRLKNEFRDPYKGQDYLNRILKGNTDWLTSGRMAGKVGAIERVEQITGKKVLEPALREMAAAYINNPDVLSMPSFDLKSIIGAIVPGKTILRLGAKVRPKPMFGAARAATRATPTGAASVGVAAEQAQAERQRRPIPLGVVRPAPRPLFRKAS